MKERWFETRLDDRIILPGSMLTNQKGFEVKANQSWTGGFWNNAWFDNDAYKEYRKPGQVKISFWLQPDKYYVGPAWYQKEIEIPERRKGEMLEIFMERCHWESQCWIDTIQLGMENSLSTPHVFQIPSDISPGMHILTIRMDNRVKDINPGLDAHSISDNTQTNWNGITGKIEMREKPRIHFEQVNLFPDIPTASLGVQIRLNELPADPEGFRIRITVYPKNHPGKRKTMKAGSEGISGKTILLNFKMDEDILLWDEFNPNLYTVEIELSGEGNSDRTSMDVGFRKFSANGRHLEINGRRIFLRGTLECAIFPKTGYPPTNTAEWARIFTIARKHGLNHFRFHSWCPPLAAFQAADSVGVYLAVECGAWANIGNGEAIDSFIYRESRRIVDAYGNHPSFCMMAYGNEPSGVNHEKFLSGFVSYWKEKDPRRIYTSSHGWANVPENDYQSSPDPRIQHWAEGLQSIINSRPPSTGYDWSEIIQKFEQPVVSHEIGQWCVYPNIQEIEKYDGPLKAKNFEIFRDRLAQNNLLPLADSLRLASGKLQALCYKADIEAALRTADQGGFQLLDLHDFPGQGSAIVGILDPFWDEKGYITPDQFREFCNATVPLARMDKLIYNNNESFSADFELAHYGEEKSLNTEPAWEIKSGDGSVLYKGNLQRIEKPEFGLVKLGRVELPLEDIKSAMKLTLVLRVGDYKNQWEFWVYPSVLPEVSSEKLLVCSELNHQAIKTLESGGSVLLSLKKGSVRPEMGAGVGIGFSSIFWNTSWTNGQLPHTLGILCNPGHPALKSFPAEYHSNYQWWDAMTHCSAIRIDKINQDIQPVVRVIDDWFTARPLAVLFECRIGKGKILVSGIDLITDLDKRPEARQLLFSLKSYMAGDEFNPQVETDTEKIKAVYF